MGQDLRFTVDARMQGGRIDRLLAEQFPTITRSRFQKLLRGGHVTARGRKVRSAYRVLAGDDIRVHVPAPEPLDLEPADIPLRIVHEDEDLLVLDKPAGLVVHPAAGNRRGTLVHALLFHRPQLAAAGSPERPGIVHRLDKDTSGLLVVAKTERAHVGLGEALRRRMVCRAYAALVWGRPRDDRGRIEAAIGRSASDRKRMAVRADGRPALTRYRVRERFDFAALLDVELATGRTHQIRVHLAHIGHPVFGDPTYGGRNSRLTQLPAPLRVVARKALEGMPRQALHAARLTFQHPVTGRTLRFDASLPGDFAGLLILLRRPLSGDRA